MATPLKAALINYYVQLTSTDLKMKEFVENLKRPVQALKNQSEQYCHVIRFLQEDITKANAHVIEAADILSNMALHNFSKDVDNAEICKLDDLREKLIFKISMGIEDEVSQIFNEFRRLKNHVEELKMKFNRLENARCDALVSDESFKELVDGTPYVPKLDLLMEWSIESYTYFNRLYGDTVEKFKNLNYKDTKGVEDWAKWIKRHERDQERIKHILSFTQFLTKESVKS